MKFNKKGKTADMTYTGHIPLKKPTKGKAAKALKQKGC